MPTSRLGLLPILRLLESRTMSDRHPMYGDVLIPTDGSQRADRAVEHGLELAEDAGATVHAMNVVSERRFGETPALSSYELVFEKLAETGETLTEDVAEAARDRDLDATTTVVRGYPSEEIASYADEHDVDLIVMGRTGAGDAESPHIGSVADRVLRKANVAVSTV